MSKLSVLKFIKKIIVHHSLKLNSYNYKILNSDRSRTSSATNHKTR